MVNDPKPLAVPVRKVASLLSVSERHVWALTRDRRMPAPMKFGRARRWNWADLEGWLAAGAPSCDEWERIKAARNGGAS